MKDKKVNKTSQNEIVSIDTTIIETIKQELATYRTKIEKSVLESQVAIANTDWINSFQTIIDVIDPYGTDQSGSLKQQWIEASLYNGGTASSGYYNIIFAQKLGVVKSLLFGKAKITLPDSLATASQCIFHRRELPQQDNLVFVLMPFTYSWSDNIWHSVIKPTVQSISTYPLLCKRADDLFGIDVMQDIYESIYTSRIIIAEITGRNANVFYELGISHCLGKDVILLSQSVEHIPFDLNRFRHCIYNDDTTGHEKLKTYLKESILEILIKK